MNLLKSEAVAARAGISTRTLATRVKEANGPKPIRVGRLVSFTENEVNAWIARCGDAGPRSPGAKPAK